MAAVQYQTDPQNALGSDTAPLVARWWRQALCATHPHAEWWLSSRPNDRARAIQACGLAAPTPACHILDEAGSVYAFVSLSGRIFEGSGGPMSGMKLGTRCLFDPLNPRS